MSKSDYWTDDGLFHHMGKAYGLDKNCRTVIVPENTDEQTQDSQQPIESPLGDSLYTSKQLSVTKCVICGSVVPGKRKDRKFCSPKCRQQASRGKQLELSGVK